MYIMIIPGCTGLLYLAFIRIQLLLLLSVGSFIITSQTQQVAG